MSVTYLIHLGSLYTLSPRADHSDPHKRDNWSNFSQLIMVSTANIYCTPRTVLVLWESLRKPRTSFCSQRAFCYTQGVCIPGNSSQRSQGVKSRGNSARKKTRSCQLAQPAGITASMLCGKVLCPLSECLG